MSCIGSTLGGAAKGLAADASAQAKEQVGAAVTRAVDGVQQRGRKVSEAI